VNHSPRNLAAAVAQCQLDLPKSHLALLERYCELLWEWNKRINLTRHTDYRKFVARDLIDSLALAEFLEPGERVLDVGTGSGVPGVVLAVVRPDLVVWLAESVGKKARALAQIVRQMGLDVPVCHRRAEDVLGQEEFNTLVIRAVGRLKKLLDWFCPYWDSFDRMLIVKGPSWIDERHEARRSGLLDQLALRKLSAYSTPGTGVESVVLQVCPKQRMTAQKKCRLSASRITKPKPQDANHE